jgi:hypothetical protein
MKRKILNSTLVWKQLEDFVVPNLALTVLDRAVYSHLLRHSRLEGKNRLHFSLAWLANGVGISEGAARPALLRLIDHGALRLIERSKAGHLVEVFLPEEIPVAVPHSCKGASLPSPVNGSLKIDELNFFREHSLREAIHARERGSCFYCLCRLKPGVRCLDHVVPQSRGGGNSYRNVVSCCLECNSRKGQTPAGDFLRWLYRQRRLTARELTARLRAADTLAAGKLRPPLPAATSPQPPTSGAILRPAQRRHSPPVTPLTRT